MRSDSCGLPFLVGILNEEDLGGMLVERMFLLYFFEYSVAAEPPVLCGESHRSGQTEPPY